MIRKKETEKKQKGKIVRKDETIQKNAAQAHLSPDEEKGESSVGISPPRRVKKSRIVFKVAKILLLYVPLCVLFFAIIGIAGLSIYLTPQRAEKLIVEQFNARSYGDITLKVKRFGLFRGFEIEDVIIRNGEEFGRTPFVEIKRIVCDYRILPMLVGNVRINEIGIYQPRIYLKERNGVWNAARLMKPGEPRKEEEKPEPEEEPRKESREEISLPISVEFLFKFVLEDLRVYAEGSGMKTSLEGFSCGVDVYVPPFKKIPLSSMAVSIFERMKIELNPKEELNLHFVSETAEVSPPLILFWKLVYKKPHTPEEAPHFESSLKLGTYRTPVRFKRAHLAPLSFLVSYDMLYNPANDLLNLNHFTISFSGKKLISLSGEVREVTTRQRFNIRMLESNISLTDLYPYYRSITGDTAMRFAGSVSLYPFIVKGDPKNIDVDGQLRIGNLYFRNPAIEARVPAMMLGYSVRMRGNDVALLSDLKIPHFDYVLNRGKSGDNGLLLSLNAQYNLKNQYLLLNDISMRFYSPASGRDALKLGLNGKVSLAPVMVGNVRMATFQFMKDPLLEMVPKPMARDLGTALGALKNPVNLDLSTGFRMDTRTIAADVLLACKIPDFKINDLVLTANIEQNALRKMLFIRKVNLSSKERNLSVDVGGQLDLENPPGKNTDVGLRISLNMPEMKEVFEKWALSGNVEITARQKGDIKTGVALGAVKIAHLNVKNPEKKVHIEDFNLNFPFEYNHKIRLSESRIAVDKSTLLETAFFRDRDNFTIKSISIKHPARDISFQIIKDFSATMFFRDNTFEIPTMKAYVMGGGFYGRNILFALRDFKTDNMEYSLTLDVTNVDIGLLDEPNPQKRTRDAELSLNAQFKGRGVDVKKELTPVGYINIHKIGDKFANRLLKGLSSEKGRSKLGIAQYPVDNSMMVSGFNFNLDKGLVYTTVTFNRKAIGWLVGIEQNKVQFERIKLQEYLRNILGGD
ncbi:MAG: AsmA family protein [Spirochaetes bacterium]|nr:AsmA family protein [Spirochaetota bacterium]